MNTLRGEREALRAELPVPTHVDAVLPEAVVVDGALDLQRQRPWREGLCLAQSRAAMLVSRALDPQPGERVLDLCAAPGGKTTHIAALMRDEGEVVALERDPRRARSLAQVARPPRNRERARGGGRCPAARHRERPLRARGRARDFDRVLVDPPCSGLGTLQGNPDLRWRMTPRRQIGQLGRQQLGYKPRSCGMSRNNSPLLSKNFPPPSSSTERKSPSCSDS